MIVARAIGADVSARRASREMEPLCSIGSHLKYAGQRLQDGMDTKWLLLVLAGSVVFLPLLSKLLAGEAALDLLDLTIISFLGCSLLYSAHRLLGDHRPKERPVSPDRARVHWRLPTPPADAANRRPLKRGAERGPRIDPRYFKPSFIYTELLSIWDTTYTVISWGSVWLVGGTILAGERLAQRIKTKCTREAHTNDSFNDCSGGQPAPASPEQAKSPYKRLSAWTKRSRAAMRKKLNKVINPGVLRISNVSE